MKLIIDIPEDYYKSLQKHGAGSCAENTILNGTLLSECKLEDCITVNIQGLDEGIRCAMCTNTMANDRGCDGACRVDDVMYSKVLKVIQDCTVPSVYPKSDKPSGKWIRQMKSEIADSLEFWDYSPNNNPLARDILETVNTYCAKMESEE